MEYIRSIFFHYIYVIIKWYFEKRSHKSLINGKIIVYHHVTDEEIDEKSKSCICSPSVFRRTLDDLKKNNYDFVTIDEAINRIDKKSSKKFVVITFDDIPQNVFTNAYPILKELNIPFIVYITVNYINKEGFISNEQLDILNNEPICTIGSHTISHPMLRFKKDSYSEIFESKKWLENRLNRSIDHFAYPYGRPGAISLKNIREVKKAGFTTAVSTIFCDISDYTAQYKYYLPRIFINL